ncbi:MAG TPA: hypothetical protein VIJ57_12355, partial [Hanamia sp.]
FSSIFVLPIEMTVWGGGALLIRYVVRRWKLGWLSMLLLGVALAIAEECLIQQTSLAPMVIKLKGETYARAFGVNYVYFLWAIIYEPVFVIFLSINLVELIFPKRKDDLWISRGGMFVVIPLFILGSFLAWFSWTQIARVKVFHLPPFNPSLTQVIIAVVAICILIFIATKSLRSRQPRQSTSIKIPAPLIPGILGCIWATLLFGLVLLGFGIAPHFPPFIAVAGAVILLIVFPVVFLPRLINSSFWTVVHQYGLVCGTVIGSMLVSQLGFMDTTGADLYFKIITNIIAVILLIILGNKVKKRTEII